MPTRPRIICHMLSSIDGRIDGASLRDVMVEGDYEATGDSLNGDAWICGRTTMEQHFALKERFVSKTNQSAGPQKTFVARRAKSYAISVDTLGKLDWSSGDVHGDHLICIVSERAPSDYITMLRDKQISYIVAGESSVDLPRAMNELREHFGIRTLLLEGGGHINGAFLEADLVDEVSLIIVPGIDGRASVAATFDGMSEARRIATRLKLMSCDRRDNDTLWLRYEVLRA